MTMRVKMRGKSSQLCAVMYKHECSSSRGTPPCIPVPLGPASSGRTIRLTSGFSSTLFDQAPLGTTLMWLRAWRRRVPRRNVGKCRVVVRPRLYPCPHFLAFPLPHPPDCLSRIPSRIHLPAFCLAFLNPPIPESPHSGIPAFRDLRTPRITPTAPDGVSHDRPAPHEKGQQ
jgi:hypothetical protein